MKRVILDTNVFVSAVLGGAIRPVLEYWQTGSYTLIVTNEILQEYLTVLRRPKFGLPSTVIESIVAYVFRKSEFVTPIEQFKVVDQDPDDNKFLDAAFVGEVDYLVSGDKHLLEIKEFRQIPIISLREFLDQIER